MGKRQDLDNQEDEGLKAWALIVAVLVVAGIGIALARRWIYGI